MVISSLIAAVCIAAGAAGIGTGIHGAVKMNEASETISQAKSRYESNMARYAAKQEATLSIMNDLGTLELKTIQSFKDYADLMEVLQNRPEFREHHQQEIPLPVCNMSKLREISIGAELLLNGVKGAGAGVISGIVAHGVISASIAALGTASTGAAISSLSGIAATKAVLAVLGGGTIAAGGGGVALGTALLGGSSFGIGILVVGIITEVHGRRLSEQADKIWEEMLRSEGQINEIVSYLDDLSTAAADFYDELQRLYDAYRVRIDYLKRLVYRYGTIEWDDFTEEEKNMLQSTTLLVDALYRMCNVTFVTQAESADSPNSVNFCGINDALSRARETMRVVKR